MFGNLFSRPKKLDWYFFSFQLLFDISFHYTHKSTKISFFSTFWIGTACRIKREVQNDESLEFLSLFDNFNLQDSSFATESGLYVVTKKKYPIRLYQLMGKNINNYLQLVITDFDPWIMTNRLSLVLTHCRINLCFYSTLDWN